MKTQHLQAILATEGRLDPAEFQQLLEAWQDVYELLTQTKLWRTKLAWAHTAANGAVGRFRFSQLNQCLIEDRFRLAVEAARAEEPLAAELEEMHRKFIARIESHRAASRPGSLNAAVA